MYAPKIEFQVPSLSQINPLPLASLGFLKEEPSVLSIELKPSKSRFGPFDCHRGTFEPGKRIDGNYDLRNVSFLFSKFLVV